MNTEDGALYYKETLDNKEFIAAVNESTKRVMGLSDATVLAGKKMDGTFVALNGEIQKTFDALKKATASGFAEEADRLTKKLSELKTKQSEVKSISVRNAKKTD